MDETSTNTNPDFLSGGGEMGKLIRYKDWSKTPLGSPTTWPQSLRTSVSLCIASNFPIAIAWGPQHVQIYNDGYWPITGDMHPTSMGQDFKECWISAWPVIGQAFEEASKGATRFLETQRIFLDRYGYSEETFFTFSFSPILDESGGVGGLFHPVIEQTQQTLAERRLNILPAVANHTVNARTAKEASALIMDCLKDFELDIPFVLLYSIDADGKEANLDGSVGVERDSPLAPAKINLEEHSLKSWPLIEAIQNGKSVQVEKLAEIFGSFDCGPYPEPPEQALVFPVILPDAAHNNYFLVTGVSSRRRLDEKYLLFYELLTASVTNVLTKARAYEEERKKAEALAEIDKAKMVFFSNISHEFRTPLTLMLSPLEELLNQKNNNFSEGEKENIETTHRNALRLLKLVNTLLDFSRIESGRQQGVFSLMDIAALTKNLASNFRSVIEKAGLKLIVKAESIIRPVYVDKHMWEKIVFNLLSNAFKYTLEGSIIVKLTSEKDFIVLKIKDTGVGIPENELPKMFERFHRVQNVTGRTYEGTGIGLSLIKELVKMHHGTIGVESKLNEGSVFTVKIPFGKEHLNEHQISETVNDTDEIYANIYIDEAETLLNTEKLTNESSTAKHSNLHLSTILVVDDNADMREHISSILSNNFNVITANNGMDALHKLKETIPALVLSDIMMPVMDGIGLLKEIKSNKSTANIPVILLTARAGEESRIEGWETGADDYLVKPFSSKELISRIASQIKTQQIRAASETMLKNIFMQAPVAISVLEVSEYKYVLVNPEAQKLFRRTAEQVLGKTVKELFPEAESQGLVQIFDQVLSTGVTFAVNEMPLMLEDLNVDVLRLRYLNFSVEAIKNGDGKVQSLLIVCLDTTEQVETRKKVEESESRFRLMANAIPEVIWVADVQGQPEFFNKRWEEFSGVPFEVHTAAEVAAAFLHPDDAPAVLVAFSEAIKTGRLMEVEQRNRSASGEYRWFLNRAAPYRNPQTGEIEKWFGIGTDIDERKKTEQALAESESRFRSMADASPLLIWTIDANGLSAYYNKTFLDFIGVSKDEDIADWRKIIHPEDVQSTFDTVNTAIAERRSYSLECRLLRADGHWRWVLAQGNPRMGTNNEFLGFVGSSVDITERQQAEEKLKESEFRYYEMIYSSPSQMCILKGEDLIIEIANDAIIESWGKGKDIIGKSLISVMPEIIEQGFEKLLLSVYKTGEPVYAYETPVTLIRNGKPELMHYTFIYQAQRNVNGEIEGVAIIANEVTQHVELNKKIKESEQYFRQLTDTVPAIIWITEPDGSCTYLNKNWYSYTGQTEAEAKGFGWLDATHPEDKEETGRIFLEANAQQKPFIASYRLNVKGGGYRWAIHRGSPKYSADGVFEGMIGTVVDVHEEKLAAEKTRDSEKQFSALANNIQNLAWIADGEGWIYWYNQRWYDYTGTTQEEMKGWGWQKVHHPEQLPIVIERWQQSLYTGEPFEMTFPIRGADNKFRSFLTRAEPMHDAEGKVIRWIGTNTDIEKQKNFSEQLERKVNERTGELKVANVNLEQKNIELQKMNKELEAFTYISSHDLQEPLRKIQSFSGRIIAKEKELLSESTKDFLQRMNDAASRMQTLINDLLAFSRLSTSERKFEITDLNIIVNEVKEEFKEATEEKNATIILSEMCEANIITFQFRQLMHKLIGNALKFSKQNVPLRIIIKSELISGSNSPFDGRDACHISVADNGIGFDNQFSERIFGVFQKLHGKNEYAGTGIGLAIVKKIVENHSGIITAESELGKGTTFNIYLPV